LSALQAFPFDVCRISAVAFALPYDIGPRPFFCRSNYSQSAESLACQILYFQTAAGLGDPVDQIVALHECGVSAVTLTFPHDAPVPSFLRGAYCRQLPESSAGQIKALTHGFSPSSDSRRRMLFRSSDCRGMYKTSFRSRICIPR